LPCDNAPSKETLNKWAPIGNVRSEQSQIARARAGAKRLAQLRRESGRQEQAPIGNVRSEQSQIARARAGVKRLAQLRRESGHQEQGQEQAPSKDAPNFIRKQTASYLPRNLLLCIHNNQLGVLSSQQTALRDLLFLSQVKRLLASSAHFLYLCPNFLYLCPNQRIKYRRKSIAQA
jgi:hypothetical protein